MTLFADETCEILNDPLEWWKPNHARFETVWLLAKYYLAIPATCALFDRCNKTITEETYLASRNLGLVPKTPSSLDRC
jgi:hypothetical protein